MALTGLAWEWSRLAMVALRKKYLSEGWLYVALDKIEMGGAPMLVGADEKIILLDDLLVHPQHGVRFSDGKFKDHTDIYQKGHKRSMSTDGRLRHWQHGIDLHHWYAYRRLEDLTKIAGQLSLLVFKPGANADPDPHHLWQSLAELHKHAQIREKPHNTFHRGAVYFPMDAWKCSPIDFVPPDSLPSLATHRNPWERVSKTGYAPAWEIKYCTDSPFEQHRDKRTADLLAQLRQHMCVVCGQFGAFGYGPPGWPPPKLWYCLEHRPDA